MQWSPSCGGHAHTLKFSPGKGGSRTSGFASPARVLKVKSPPRQGAWAGRVVARLVPRGCWSTGFSWGRKVLFPPFGVWTPVFPSRDGEAPAPRFSFWWEGGRTPEAAVGGEDSGTGEAQEFPRREPPTTAKAGEAGAGLDRGGGD